MKALSGASVCRHILSYTGVSGLRSYCGVLWGHGVVPSTSSSSAIGALGTGRRSRFGEGGKVGAEGTGRTSVSGAVSGSGVRLSWGCDEAPERLSKFGEGF